MLHPTIDYPGVPVDHATITKNYDVLRDVAIPVRPHFGVIAVAPAQDGLIDSIPPSSFAGNLGNWRVTRGATVYLRVAVPGALLSIGDPHASQGDSELCGTAIECSLTGDFQLVLHKSTMIERGAPSGPGRLRWERAVVEQDQDVLHDRAGLEQRPPDRSPERDCVAMARVDSLVHGLPASLSARGRISVSGRNASSSASAVIRPRASTTSRMVVPLAWASAATEVAFL